MHLAKATVLITGASSGIGRALALECAKRGAARIALVGRRIDALFEVAELVRAHCPALEVPADVMDRDEVQKAVRRAEQAFGHLDVVIANAGIGQESRELTASDLEMVTQVNYLGAATTLLAAMPGMVLRRQGHLVAVSSLAALRGLPGSAAYSASKAALDTLTESLRFQLEPSHVSVTLVRPGFVATPMTAGRKNLPFVVSAEDAARQIVDAVERDRRTLSFPRRTALAMYLLRLLPGRLYDAVARRFFERRR